MKLRRMIAAGMGVVALAMPASADLLQDVFQGLQYVATPAGQAGGQRFGRVAVLPQRFGDGYRLEFNRSFGVDSFGRSEVLDLGNFELELQGNVSMTGAFTRRGLPTANLDLNFQQLSYSIRGKTGGQDVELAGVLNGGQAVEINALGFYSYALDLSNGDGDLILDGLLIEGQEDTDFNLGPVTIQGNVYVDIFASILSTFGVDTSGLQSAFGQSPIDQIIADIQDSLAKQSGEITSRSLGNPDADAWAVNFASDLSAELGRGRFDLGDSSGEPTSPVSSIPEPSSLALIALGGLALYRRR